MDIIIRGVDEALYRRLKAKAALLGYRVSKALEEAIKIWIEASEDSVENEIGSNNKAYSTLKQDLLKKHQGKYIVFAEGKLVGIANTLEEAGKMARAHTSGRALITRLGEEQPAGGEWLWSSIELANA